MIEDLVGANIARAVGDENNLTEIRMRVARPLVYCTKSGERKVAKAYGAPYIVSQKDIDDVLMRATNMSVYSASDEMKRGIYLLAHTVSASAVKGCRTAGSCLR